MGQPGIPVDPCTDCGSCEPCPNGIDLPANLRIWRVMRQAGVTPQLRDEYGHLRARVDDTSPAGAHAGACRDCGECEARCPERVRVIRRLQDLVTAFGTDDGPPGNGAAA